MPEDGKEVFVMLRGAYKNAICYLLAFLLVVGMMVTPFGRAQASSLDVALSSSTYWNIYRYPSSQTIDTKVWGCNFTDQLEVTVSNSES